MDEEQDLTGDSSISPSQEEEVLPEELSLVDPEEQPYDQYDKFRKNKTVIIVILLSVALILTSLASIVPRLVPKTCSGMTEAKGYSEVSAAGWTIDCVDEIAGGSQASPGHYIAGLTSEFDRKIQIQKSRTSVLMATTHEIGHALDHIYSSSEAEDYYDKQMKISYWRSLNPDNYWFQGDESFAESYAYCSVTGTTEHVSSEYRLAPCSLVDETLAKMRASNKP